MPTEYETLREALKSSDPEKRRVAVLKSPQLALREWGGRHSDITKKLQELGLLEPSVLLDSAHVDYALEVVKRRSIDLPDELLRKILSSKNPRHDAVKTECMWSRRIECHQILNPNWCEEIRVQLNQMHAVPKNSPSSK